MTMKKTAMRPMKGGNKDEKKDYGFDGCDAIGDSGGICCTNDS